MHRAIFRSAILALLMLPFAGAALAQAQKPGQAPLPDMPSYKADVGPGEAPRHHNGATGSFDNFNTRARRAFWRSTGGGSLLIR